MKKLILVLIALAFAFAISSCCDQSYCPGNLKCPERYDEDCPEETPYRWDTPQKYQNGERQNRRW